MDYIGECPKPQPQHHQAYSKSQKSPTQAHLAARRSATIATRGAARGLATGSSIAAQQNDPEIAIFMYCNFPFYNTGTTKTQSIATGRY
jgi:hypothetical protein